MSEASRESERLSAACAAFAFVACADGHLHEREVARFVAWADERGLGGTAEASLRERARHFAEDFDAGRAVVLARMESLPASARDEVLAAARVAVVADGKLEPVEEAALAILCRALGVPPDEV